MNRIPSRQRCVMCGKRYAIDYHVTDIIWEAAIPQHYQNSCVCVECFILNADEQLLEWETGIKLWPLSRASHLIQTVGVDLSALRKEGI